MSRRYGAIIHPDELNMRWLERAHAAGINVLGLHPVGGVHADESLRAMIEDEFLPERRALYARARELGMDIEYEMHALSYLLPRRMFDVHPDWFRMNEQGARVADFNFCPSNRDALEYISAPHCLHRCSGPQPTGTTSGWTTCTARRATVPNAASSRPPINSLSR